MSYKRIGDLIQLVDIRNENLSITNLVGLTINKKFIPSVANTIGTDMSKYKIIRKNQFACSTMQVRRDKKMPIALLKDFDEAIISQAYPVFEVVDKNIVLPDYVMLWFTRSEFDREACFHAVGGVRGSLEWEDFCTMELPIPSIEKQREIVAQYEAITNKIKVNEAICEKLEVTAQALYKQWFVDFEFPNEEGQSYKSSGGKMIFNEELEKEIPEDWEVGTLGDICEFIDGDRGVNYPNGSDFTAEGFCLFLNAGNVTKKGFDFNVCSFITEQKDNQLRKGKLKRGDIIITSRGTVGNIAFYSDFIVYNNIRINSGMLILRPQIKESFIYSLLRSYEFMKLIANYISGSAVPQLPIKDLSVISILKASEVIMNNFSEQVEKIYNIMDSINNQNQKLTQLQRLLLSRLATLEG
ncbi:restriction endonuclease subunit S [Myroides odoratimimus]|uniref:restriction endonuclease subunit S n=1 Tax=Myroides TaxID=76831 RepID=UPI0015FD8016|nr:MULTISPECIES: restriction endonuclease subunit S [Myroides]MBB1149685.1 restriction endonuclease subunit S [Myroides sp. NP-2]MEC4077535.1 restriction endonuclease subunit S [Myroides odoratimimus]